MDTTIRRAGPQDLDALAVLFDAYRRFYGQPADLARARDWLRSRMRFGESVVLIAERDGTAAGFTQLYPMHSSVRTARTWILNDLYVADHGVASSQVVCRLTKSDTLLPDPPQHIVLLHYVQVGHCDRRGERMATEGGAVHESA